MDTNGVPTAVQRSLALGHSILWLPAVPGRRCHLGPAPEAPYESKRPGLLARVGLVRCVRPFPVT